LQTTNNFLVRADPCVRPELRAHPRVRPYSSALFDCDSVLLPLHALAGGEGVGEVAGFFMMAGHQIGPIFSPLPQWGEGQAEGEVIFTE